MFMVMDLMSGGDLKFHLCKQGAILALKEDSDPISSDGERKKCGFTEDVIRIWAGECTLALEYLHSKNIMHRLEKIFIHFIFQEKEGGNGGEDTREGREKVLHFMVKIFELKSRLNYHCFLQRRQA